MSKQLTIYGYHTLVQWLQDTPSRIKCIYIKRQTTHPRVSTIQQLAQSHDIPIEVVHHLPVSSDVNHQGLVAHLIPASHTYIKSFLTDRLRQVDHLFLLILDRVQDPHNLGACLRTACVMGVDAVIAPKDQAVGLTPAARKVASGAAQHVPFFQVTNLARTLNWLKEKGVWLYGAAEEGDTCLYDAKLTGSIAWVMGGEANGLRRLTREHCDTLVSIPAAHSFSTLNVSVATGICLAETVRQTRAESA